MNWTTTDALRGPYLQGIHTYLQPVLKRAVAVANGRTRCSLPRFRNPRSRSTVSRYRFISTFLPQHTPWFVMTACLLLRRGTVQRSHHPRSPRSPRMCCARHQRGLRAVQEPHECVGADAQEVHHHAVLPPVLPLAADLHAVFVVGCVAAADKAAGPHGKA